MKLSRSISAYFCLLILNTNPAISATFTDVPPDHWAFSHIDIIAANGITKGCGPNIYCPEDSVTRAQMAVFLERGIKGSGFDPGPGIGDVFSDVPASYWAVGWIEQLYADGITSGCGFEIYCPEDAVTREQMAVFLLRAKYGQDYAPPTPTGVFDDVDLNHWATPWIEQLANEGITTGCGPNIYCPKDAVTRAQMAVFLVRTFDLMVNTLAPTVFSTTPIDGATEILTTTTVSATFSEEIDSSTLDTDTFYIRYGTTGAFFAGTVSYANSTAIFTPAGLPYDSTLTATLTTDIKDLAGNAIESNYTWSFITADAPQASLDSSFGTSGKVITDVSGYNDFDSHADVVRDLFIQSDGKILATGDTYNGSIYIKDFALARYDNKGVLDPTFGIGGLVLTHFGGSDYLHAAVMQPDGKIIAAGATYSGGNGDLALARYNSDGTLDTTFGIDGNGKVITEIGGNEYIEDIALLPDGKIMIMGSTSGTPSGVFLARYTSDGLLDTSFGLDGIVIDSSLPLMQYVRGLSIQSDNKIVVAGYANGDIVLARYDANGALDTSFGSYGKVTTDIYANDAVEAIAVDSDGKIIISGWSLSAFDYSFILARFNADGSLDMTFGSDGKVMTTFGGLSDASGSAMSIQSDGKIVVVGSITYINGNDKPRDFSIARYTTDGSLDVAFGINGTATADFNNGDDVCYALRIQSDGKIIMAGTSNRDFALLRILAE